METTYTIEFMRLAEPPLAPIKQPSAFHVAYYCAHVLLPLLVAPNLRLRATRIDFSNTFGDPVRGVSGCSHVTILSQAAAPGIQSARRA